MAENSSRSHTPSPRLDNEPDLLRPATCPMCHTPASATLNAIDAGGAWRCVRCGQHWDAARLAVVATYAAFTVDRDLMGGRGTEGHQGMALYCDSPAGR